MEENKEKNIVNKVILITGGSRGIGASMVKLLARDGHQVVLNYNHSEKIAKKIEMLYTNTSLRLQITENAVKDVQRFESKKIMEKIQEVLE